MGATALPCATETAGPSVALTVGCSSSQESVEGTLGDGGSRVCADMPNSKTWSVPSLLSSWWAEGRWALAAVSLASQGLKLCREAAGRGRPQAEAELLQSTVSTWPFSSAWS